MKGLQILVVDDEPLARQRLIRLLNEQEKPDWIGEASNGEQALEQVKLHQPDVVLLDIRMPGMDGMAAAQSLRDLPNPPMVIFCTAYDEHAIAAFKVQALDYLLKPVKKDELGSALERAKAIIKEQTSSELASRRRHISARSYKGWELILVSEIRYFQADQKYVTVRHGEGEVIIDQPLKELEQEFDDLFVRIHRNTLVARKYIEGLEDYEGGRYLVKLAGINEKPLVSRRHVASVRQLIQNM